MITSPELGICERWLVYVEKYTGSAGLFSGQQASFMNFKLGNKAKREVTGKFEK